MLGEFARELGLPESLELIDQVACRLRDHRFTVAVLGEFKTGKSTFVNALLGVDVLPTDVIPSTATLNRVTYGITSDIEVVYKDGRREQVGFDRLREYVTKEFVTVDQLASVEEVVVRHPAPYLLNNVDIIDTPGLNDEPAMTAVTLSVLPRADAVVLVISALSPFSDLTRQFLEEHLLPADVRRIIVLVNRLGQLSSTEDADRIIVHVAKRIHQDLIDKARREFGEDSAELEVYVKKVGKPHVFGIDADDALRGLMNNDANVFNRSGFIALQNGLRRFLTEDRAIIALQVPVSRILAASDEILNAVQLKMKAANVSLSELTARYDAAQAELNHLRRRKREVGNGEASNIGAGNLDMEIQDAERILNELIRQKDRQEILSHEQIRKLDRIAERTRAILESANQVNKRFLGAVVAKPRIVPASDSGHVELEKTGAESETGLEASDAESRDMSGSTSMGDTAGVSATPAGSSVPFWATDQGFFTIFFIFLLLFLGSVGVYSLQQQRERERTEAAERIRAEEIKRQGEEERQAAEQRRQEEERKRREEEERKRREEQQEVEEATRASERYHAYLNARAVQLGAKGRFVTLQNACPGKTLSVAALFQLPDDSGKWLTSGWFVLLPGEKRLTDIITKNPNVYLYAYSNDGTYTLNGDREKDPVEATIVGNRFSYVRGESALGTEKRSVKMRQYYVVSRRPLTLTCE
jgi:hypothetical protein